jgi:hypothetical protein
MSEDLITHSFTEAVDKGTIKKIISIIRIILLLCIVYSFLDVWQWYTYLSTVSSVNNKFKDFYKFAIFPAIAIIKLAERIVSLILNLNGTKLLYASFVNDEVMLFNQGYKLLYKSAVLTVVTFAMGIAAWIIRIILKV